MFKKPLWIILTVSLLLSLPAVWERITTEWNNNVYEFIVPYEEITELAISTDSETTEIMRRLKNAGVQSISLEPITLVELSLMGDIVILSPERVREFALFSNEMDIDMTHGTQGFYIHVLNETNLTSDLSRFFEDKELETVSIQGKKMLYIPGEKNEVLDKTLSYSNDTIDEIKQAGLTFIPRIPSLEESDVDRVLEETIALRGKSGGRVVPSGKHVFGMQNPNKIKEVAGQLVEANYNVYQIEGHTQGGFNTLAYSMDMNIIRMHSINLSQIEKHAVAVDRSVRAVKERNIRSLFLRFDKENPEESLMKVEKYLQDVQNQIPKQFVLGEVKPFDKYSVSLLNYITAFIALIAFIMIATEKIFKIRKLTIAVGVGLAILSIAYLLLEVMFILKAFALLTAIVTPVFAVLWVKMSMDESTKKSILRNYLSTALIAFIGITIVISLLNGNDYLVGVNLFKGVKLLLIIPIVFLCLYVLYGSYKKIAKQPILYLHAALAIVIFALVVYYIGRSGNAGVASDLELTIRQLLEQWLYARPRTKEFLIGFPLFVLALYVYPRQKTIGMVLLIPSIIGFISLVNTFTHMHIPLYISLLRSVLGLAIGYVFGLILIYIVKKATGIYNRYLKQRCKS
ncbi:DUF5693 family protein [Sporosarcina siberiensis]|uniref:DUF5693 family protein n=1 Tax=Sporosarcina siberiensis TaxID=1365606 RepID=A0ABW4SKZ1_9BACL